MSRPLTSFMDKEGADVAKMDFCLPNAVPNFDTEAKSPKTVFKAEMDAFLSNAFLTFDNILNTESLSEVMHDAGSANPCGVEEDSPANAGAKSPTVFEAEMDLFLSDAFRSFDTVLTTGPLSEFGKAAGSVNPCGEVEEKEMEKVSPAYAEAKSPTMLGRSCQDSGMDFVLPCAVADSVLNIGSLLDRHRGSSIPQGQGKEFTPTFDGANSPIDSNISPDQRKTSFDRAWRGKVEPVPAPQLEADPAIPDVREVVDLAFWSKTKIGPKKQKQKASKSRLYDLQGEKTVVQAQHVEADSAIPVGMDGADFACPESNICIRTEKQKTWKSRLFGWFQRGNLESVPTPQLDADLANPVGRDVADLACHEAKTKIRPDKRRSMKCCFLDRFRKSDAESMPTPQLDADLANPVGMDGADLACHEAKPKIRPDKGKSLKRCFLDRFRKSDVESVPTPQLDADLANPVGMDGADLASRELNPHISFPAIANASLENLGAVPPNVGLKGGGNPDSNRPQAIGNPRTPVPKDAGNPVPKDAGNPVPKDAGNPVPKDAGNPVRKYVKVVRPKTFNLFKKRSNNQQADPEPGPSVTTETFESKYQLLEMDVIGQGSFGVVFKGIRQTDGNLVAIKQMMKQKKKDRYIQIPGYPQPLLTEIALMLRLRESYHCPYIIEMYDWYETSKMFTIAMEYPQESQSLWSFVYKYKLSESAARHLMYQAVRAVEHCLMNGVVHTDIHPGNFLVQKKTMTLKLIDFGLGHLFRFDGHASKDFRGAKECTPPEVQTNKKFFARPANTWALGGMLYFMMHAAYPYPISDLYAGEPKKYDEGLSKEICELIDWCLDVRPDRRPWLHQILSHDWFRTEWINEKPEFKRRKSKRKATTKAEEAEG
nr:uncharacterized protein LOC129444978 [Misgurnus anguillicaudatus]